MKKIRIGIIGYGNVGRAMVELLDIKHELLKKEGLDVSLTSIITKNGAFLNPEGLNCALITGQIRAGIPIQEMAHVIKGFEPGLNLQVLVENKAFDVLAEFTGTNRTTGEPGLGHIKTALKNDIHVITGNKGPFLVAWDELFNLARERCLLLGIGCTTGGALPTILNGRDSMAGSDVTLIEGVLNGTTNFILSRMEELGVSFEVALKEAQSLGIAEANPESDVGGWDTAAKLFILCKIVMGGSLTPDDISVTGIKDVTADEVSRAMNDGGRIRLIGKAFKKDGAVCASVSPQVVKGTHPFYFLSAQNKAVRYVSDTLGELMVSGGASGPLPAAASALRDLVNARRSGLI